jgi:hypothetical protein
LIDIEATTPDHHDQPPKSVSSGVETVATVDKLRSPPQKGEDKQPAKERATIDGVTEQVLSPATTTDEPVIEPIVEEPPPVQLADEQLESLLAQIEGDEKLVDPEDSLMDSFWDEALGEDSGKATPGISLDEARDQGLIGPDFDIGEG